MAPARPADQPRSSVTRRDILECLISDMRPRRHVIAFWEGGAAAFGRLDEWSDLDLYMLVDDGEVENTFDAVEGSMRRLSPIEQILAIQGGFEGVSQKFYRLKHANEYAVVDLSILTQSSPEKFLTPQIHGRNIFYFNKDRTVKPPRFDPHAFQRTLKQRRKALSARLSMFGNFVPKEINRNNSLEALENYRTIVFSTLVESLRMKHNPVHYDFRMRYIHRELPPGVVRRLERLAYAKDMRDLARKHREARSWCEQTLDSLG